jgi:hypothetical protein
VPLILGPLAVGFFALFAALVLLGLSQSQTATHGSTDVGGFWSLLKEYLGAGGLLGQLAKLSRAVLSRVAGSQLKHVTAFFGSLGFLIGYTYKTNAATAEASAKAAQALDHRQKAAAKRLARQETRDVAKLHGQVRAANAHAARVGHELDRYKAHTTPQIKHATHAVDVTLPHRIAGVRQREEALSRDQAKLRERTGLLERGAERTFDWIRSHPLSAVTGVFAGAVAVALARLGFGFMRCRSWQRLGRSLTCNDANIIADLLAAATLVVGIMSLEELAREEQKVVGEAAKLVRGFWEA